MTTNITTLALNILISERRNHRLIFATRITELLPEGNDVSEKEKVLKSNFLSIIAKCVEDPNCEVRDIFYQLSQYYNQKVNGFQQTLSVAA
jgi:hypothetical protein